MFNITSARSIDNVRSLYEKYEIRNMVLSRHIRKNQNKFVIATRRVDTEGRMDGEYTYGEDKIFMYNRGKKDIHKRYPLFYSKRQVIKFFRDHVRYYWNIVIPYTRLRSSIGLHNYIKTNLILIGIPITKMMVKTMVLIKRVVVNTEVAKMEAAKMDSGHSELNRYHQIPKNI